MVRSFFRRWLIRVLMPFAMLAFLVEDLLLRHLGQLLARLAHWPILARFEGWAARLPAYAALALVGSPSLIIIGVELAGIVLLASGGGFLALALIIAVKLLATAVVGRLLVVCRPALLTIGWFVVVDHWVVTTRRRIHVILEASWVWRLYLSTKLCLQRRFARVAAGRGWFSRIRRLARFLARRTA